VNFTVGDHTAPTFTVPADVIIEKDANCNYNASSVVTGDVTDENDNCSTGLNATFTDVVSTGTCDGETIIKRTWKLQDNCLNVTTKVQTITIRDVTAPTFTAPPDKVIFADASCGYDASPGITGDVTDEADNCDHTLNAVYTDVTVNGSCIGEKIITRTWTLTDDCGNSTSHKQTIMVKDVTPPEISNVSADPNSLWPPNHKMRDVEIRYVAKDNCSPVTSTLSISSNEPVNGSGDGNTGPDWQVIDNHHVKLRAERSGNGAGRIYTITITSRDDCGNVSTATVTVVVSHDQSLTRSSQESADGLEINVMPNPSKKGFTLRTFSNDTRNMITLQISDQIGRIIETRKVAEGTPVTIGEFFRPGNYYVRALQGKQHATVKLIKLTD
jgi:hypothetical protein